MEWTEYKIQNRERTKKFALNILKLSEVIPGTTNGKALNYQLMQIIGQHFEKDRRKSFLVNYQFLWKKQTKLKCGWTY